MWSGVFVVSSFVLLLLGFFVFLLSLSKRIPLLREQPIIRLLLLSRPLRTFLTSSSVILLVLLLISWTMVILQYVL